MMLELFCVRPIVWIRVQEDAKSYVVVGPALIGYDTCRGRATRPSVRAHMGLYFHSRISELPDDSCLLSWDATQTAFF